MARADVDVQDQPGQSRWEATLGGELAGFAEYRRDGERIVFTHTVVDPAHEGQGIGSALARAALDDARAQGLAVVPRCSFIRAWIDKHPDYVDLLA